MTSVIDLAKKRVIDEMLRIVSRDAGDVEKNAKSSSHGIVLVVDSHTLKIISSVCRRYEISDQGVLFIEQIDKPRQPFPDLDVVYFVTDSSLELVLKDHQSTPLYRYTHLFLSRGKFPDSIMDKLTANKEFVSRCRNLFELNLDFVAFEPKVFHIDDPMAIHEVCEQVGDTSVLVEAHVYSILSVFASLGEKPVLRYQGDSASTVTQRIALGLRREIDELAKTTAGDKFKAHGSTCLLLDRSIETAGLLIHDFYYQGLALDILDGVGGSGVKWGLGGRQQKIPSDDQQEQAMSVVPSFEYKTVSGKGVEEVKKVILSESDPLWVRFRHSHFRVASDEISRDIQQLVRNSDLARMAVAGKDSASPNSATAQPSDPLELLRSIPEYQDQISKLGVHVELSKKLIEVFDKLSLMDVSKLEQELATGVDDDGKEIFCAKIFQNLCALCNDGRIGPEERLRLVMLYLSQVDDVTDAVATELVRSIAQLEGDFEKAVIKFLSLGIHGTRVGAPLQPDGVLGSSKMSAAIQANKHSMKQLSKIPGRNKIKINRVNAKNSRFVNCRFESELKAIVEMAILNQLPLASFPAVGGTGLSNYVTNAVDGSRTPPTSAAAQWGQTAQAVPTGRQKIIVFVVGGITLGEAREMEELESKYNMDVFIGGSCLLTPKRLVEILLTK